MRFRINVDDISSSSSDEGVGDEPVPLAVVFPEGISEGGGEVEGEYGRCAPREGAEERARVASAFRAKFRALRVKGLAFRASKRSEQVLSDSGVMSEQVGTVGDDPVQSSQFPQPDRFEWVGPEVLEAASVLQTEESVAVMRDYLLPCPKDTSPNQDEYRVNPCSADDRVCMFEQQSFYMYVDVVVSLGVRLPFTKMEMALLRKLKVAPSQLHPSTWAFLRAFQKYCSAKNYFCTANSFLYLFHPQAAESGGKSWILVKARDHHRLFDDFASSWDYFKPHFFKYQYVGEGRAWFQRPSGSSLFPMCWRQEHYTEEDSPMCFVPKRERLMRSEILTVDHFLKEARTSEGILLDVRVFLSLSDRSASAAIGIFFLTLHCSCFAAKFWREKNQELVARRLRSNDTSDRHSSSQPVSDTANYILESDRLDIDRPYVEVEDPVVEQPFSGSSPAGGPSTLDPWSFTPEEFRNLSQAIFAPSVQAPEQVVLGTSSSSSDPVIEVMAPSKTLSKADAIRARAAELKKRKREALEGSGSRPAVPADQPSVEPAVQVVAVQPPVDISVSPPNFNEPTFSGASFGSLPFGAVLMQPQVQAWSGNSREKGVVGGSSVPESSLPIPPSSWSAGQWAENSATLKEPLLLCAQVMGFLSEEARKEGFSLGSHARQALLNGFEQKLSETRAEYEAKMEAEKKRVAEVITLARGEAEEEIARVKREAEQLVAAKEEAFNKAAEDKVAQVTEDRDRLAGQLRKRLGKREAQALKYKIAAQRAEHELENLGDSVFANAVQQLQLLNQPHQLRVIGASVLFEVDGGKLVDLSHNRAEVDLNAEGLPNPSEEKDVPDFDAEGVQLSDVDEDLA